MQIGETVELKVNWCLVKKGQIGTIQNIVIGTNEIVLYEIEFLNGQYLWSVTEDALKAR